MTTSHLERAADGVARVLGRPCVYVPVTFLILLMPIIAQSSADLDIFARVAVGRLVEAHGAPLAQDPFAFTETLSRWIDHEWLSGVVFYHISQLGGDQALFAFKVAMMLLSLVLLSAARIRYTDHRSAAFPWLLLMLAPAGYLWIPTVRSQVFTYTLLPLLLLILVYYRQSRDWRPLMVLPVAMLVWANLHGGFVVGLGLLGIFAVVTAIDELRLGLPVWLTLLACALATLINPYGLDYWPYIFDAVSMERSQITEWRPIGLISVLGIGMLGTAGIMAWGHFTRRVRIPTEGLLMSAVALGFAFSSGRLVAIFFMIAVVYGTDAFAAYLEWLRGKFSRHYTMLRTVLLAYLTVGIPVAAAIVLGFVLDFRTFRLDYSRFPVAALEWLRTHEDGGHLLANFNVGSYALWRLYPQFLIAVDGRYEEVYPESTVDRARWALDPGHPQHEVALREVAPDYILLSAAAGRLDRVAAFAPAWSVLYRDSSFAILGRGERRGNAASAATLQRPMWKAGF